jgi:monofunctional biosynthetic peptidoglycan transglycosylase
MKAINRRRLILGSLYTFALLIFFSPLYMYFSYDVGDLETMYPTNIQEGAEDPEYILKKERPSNWVNLSQISSYGKWAIILSEDWAFYDHEGIDLEQMKTALNEMMSASRFRGASTITQQMVKNVFLSESRTIWRKFHEIILAQKVEKVLTKQKILEVYLNVIEYGPAIYGIKKASWYYFKKSPSQLTAREASFLAMLLPSPKKYHVSFKNRVLTKFAQKRIKAILTKMRMAKILTPDQFNYEVNSRMSWERY